MASELQRQIDQYAEKISGGGPAHLYAKLSELYRRAGLLDDAVKTARQGVALHPESLVIREALGMGLFDQGDAAGAAESLAPVVDKLPDNGAAAVALAAALMRMGKSAEAAKVLRRRLDRDPLDQACRNLLQGIKDQGGHVEAEAAHPAPAVRAVPSKHPQDAKQAVKPSLPIEPLRQTPPEPLREPSVAPVVKPSSQAASPAVAMVETSDSPPVEDDEDDFSKALGETADEVADVFDIEIKEDDSDFQATDALRHATERETASSAETKTPVPESTPAQAEPDLKPAAKPENAPSLEFVVGTTDGGIDAVENAETELPDFNAIFDENIRPLEVRETAAGIADRDDKTAATRMRKIEGAKKEIAPQAETTTAPKKPGFFSRLFGRGGKATNPA